MTTEEYKKSIEEDIKRIDEVCNEIGNDLFGHGETLEYYRTDPKGKEKWEYCSNEILPRIKARRELENILTKITKGEIFIDKPWVEASTEGEAT